MANSSPLLSAEQARWFHQRLMAWARTNSRAFAWREQHDPYAILIAEMMLHRTQARQVEPVYRLFLQRYPDSAALAQADGAEVAEILAPLGLAWRAANFVPLARALCEDHGGQVPRERSALLALPGVGPYVADAVRIFAYDQAAALVDTNTVRVAGRFFGFPAHGESRRRRPVQEAVAKLIDPAHPRETNLALLDLAAQICRPKMPLCTRCPVAEMCSYQQSLQSELSETGSKRHKSSGLKADIVPGNMTGKHNIQGESQT